MNKFRKNARKHKTCLICKKDFIPTRKKYNTCSKKCGGLYRRSGQQKRCVICRNYFYIKPYHVKMQSNANCCSIKCRGEWWSRRLILLDRGKIPMKWYASGAKFERKGLIELREKEGCQIVTRSPQSRGIFDLYGIKFSETEIELYLIQVKALKNTSTVNAAVPKKERAIMLEKIKQNIYPVWANSKKLRGRPDWATRVYFEIWIYEKRKELHKFRLNLDRMDFV